MNDITEESCYSILLVKNEGDKNRFIETWHRSWIEEGYAQPNDDIITKYSKYDSFSLDFLLLKANQSVGTLRIITHNTLVGLPVFNEFKTQKVFNENEKICEATLLSVHRTHRQADTLSTFMLLIELWRYVRTNNVDGIVIAADIRLWHLLTRIFALEFKKIGGQKMYEGSITIPGYLNVKKQKESSMQSLPKNILHRAFQEI